MLIRVFICSLLTTLFIVEITEVISLVKRFDLGDKWNFASDHRLFLIYRKILVSSNRSIFLAFSHALRIPRSPISPTHSRISTLLRTNINQHWSSSAVISISSNALFSTPSTSNKRFPLWTNRLRIGTMTHLRPSFFHLVDRNDDYKETTNTF